MDISREVEKLYGQRLRLRVSGLCLQQNKILMVHHKGLGPMGELWAPPGGGMEFGSSAAENLRREFREETGLQVKVHALLFVHEYLLQPLHALELFFMVEAVGGQLLTGTDPESAAHAQLIEKVSFLSWQQIKTKPPLMLHQIFQHNSSLEDLISMRGYHNFSA